MWSVYRIWVGKPEENRLHGESGRKWEDNIKMVLTEIGRSGMNGLLWYRTGTRRAS
jgi:hypothetical protein